MSIRHLPLRHFLAILLPFVLIAWAFQTHTAPTPNAAAIAQAAKTSVVHTPSANTASGPGNIALCAACHGLNGQPAIPRYPVLAGQHADYTIEQTMLIISGQRHSGLAAVMRGAASNVTAQDIRAIAAWYANQPPLGQPLSVGNAIDARQRSQARALYFRGDAQRAIPACSSCHGAIGQGNPGPPYPRIRGQASDYLIERLTAYARADDRPRDDVRYRIMQAIAAKLSNEEIHSIAWYLHAPTIERPYAASTQPKAPPQQPSIGLTNGRDGR